MGDHCAPFIFEVYVFFLGYLYLMLKRGFDLDFGNFLTTTS